MSDNEPEFAKDEKGRFVTGNIGGGRPKGSRNKLGEKFLEDLLTDWEGHGTAAITEMRTKDPSAYVRVVASTLPKELNVKVSELDELSDDELSRRYDALTKALVAAGFGAGAGDPATQEPQPSAGLRTLQ